MPKIISPVIDSTVTISLTHEDAVTLADALDQVLDCKSSVWLNRTIRDHVAGGTCNDFLKTLRAHVTRDGNSPDAGASRDAGA